MQESKSSYIIYKHTSPSGKVYIGITMQGLKKRCEGGSGYKKCPAFYAAILKYGWDNFKHEVLFENLTKQEAEQKEIELIKEYRSTDKRFGYNIQNGGNTTGSHSEETKRKIGEGNRGKVYSEESLKKMRAAHKGKQIGEENPFFGRHHTEAVKKKHSEFMKGNQYYKGKHHTEEFREWKSKQMAEYYRTHPNASAKRVLVKGIEYYSLRRAAESNGISISKACKLVNDEQNTDWRYINEQRT